MRSILISATILLLALSAAAQTDSEYDPESEPVHQAFGDLNKDGLEDLVTLTPIPSAEDSVAGFLCYKLVAFLGDGDGNFEPWKTYDKSIVVPLNDFISYDLSLSVKRGSIHIEVGEFASAGSWSSDNYTFVFRYQNDDFYLIGHEHDSFARNTGKGEKNSFNHLTHKKLTTTYNAFDENVPQRSKWSDIPEAPLRPLSKFFLPDEI